LLTIPYRRAQFTSPRRPDDFADRLRSVTDRSWWRAWSQADARFVGRLTHDGFRLSYVSGGQNTYAPWIRGTIRPEGDGSVIEVRMTLHPAAVVFVLSFWSFAVWLGRQSIEELLTVSVMSLVFHVGMYYIGFRSEALDAEVLLREVAALPSQPAGRTDNVNAVP
jgi:hypothetical protein